MKKVLFYYVHHQGLGHLKLFQRLKPALENLFDIHIIVHSAELAGKLDSYTKVHTLSPKIDPSASHFDHTFSKAFEGVPYGKFPVQRAGELTELVRQYSPALFISDGSAELAIMMRSFGIPVVYNHLLGVKDADPTQVFAYHCADIISAFFPDNLELDGYAFGAKTKYFGFLSDHTSVQQSLPNTVSIILGSDKTLEKFIPDIASEIDADIQVIGESHDVSEYPRVKKLGHVDSLETLSMGDVVITSAGLNSLSDLIAMHKHIIAVPGKRPYDEQYWNAVQCERAGYCVVHDDNTKSWNALIDEALSQKYTRKSVAVDEIADSFAQMLKDRYAL